MKSIILGTLLVSSVAFGKAGGPAVMFRPALMYTSSVSDDGKFANPNQNTKRTTTRTDLIVGLGYRMANGLYLGVTYYSGSSPQKQEVGGAATYDFTETWTSYGPSVGYVGTNFFVTGTYHFSPQSTYATSSTTTTFTGGTGYQIDVGYEFDLTDTITVGPQFTYYVASYKRYKNSVDAELPDTRLDTFFRPALEFTVSF